MKHLFTLAGVLLALSAAADPIKRIKFPALSPDGSQIAFSWQGDIWLVSAQGGRAERLTVHAALDTRPKWFPDGKRVAFTSSRFGSPDILTMNADGTDIRRVTFASSTETTSSVSPDGQHIFGQTNAFGRSDIFRVSVRGGDLVRLSDHPLEAEFLPVVTPDGKSVLYNRGAYGHTAWQKKGMTSASLPEIWMADNTVPLSNHRRITNNERTDLSPQVASDGSIFYISNADGTPNVWQMHLNRSARKLTSHTIGTARNLSISSDGGRVAYEYDSELHVLNTRTGVSQRISVTVPDDARNNPVSDISLQTGVTSYAVSPDGKRAVLTLRGDIFLIPEKGGTTRRLTTNVAWDVQPTWLNNTTVLYTSARQGSKREIRQVTIAGEDKTFFSDPKLDVVHPAVSPDGKLVAFHRGESEICVVPAAGGEARTLLRGHFADALEGQPWFTWAPDSKSVVAAVLNGRRVDVKVAFLEGDRKVVVAKLVHRPQMGVYNPPRFLPNGRGVYMLSPEVGQNVDLFIVDLVPQELTFTEDDLDKLDEKAAEKKGEPTVEIYEPGIELRLRRLTFNGASSPMASPDSKNIWVTVVQGAASQLVAVPVAGGTPTPVGTITSASQLQLARDGRKLYYVSTGRLFSLVLAGPPTPVAINFNAQFSVNLREEEVALFQDIKWAMERLYYDPTLHGKDWPAITARYEKIMPYAYDRNDFYNLMGEMMEEIESSHLGTAGPVEEAPGTGSDSTAYLGIDIEPRALDARRSYFVESVMPGSPADDPQSLLKKGDKIVEVDGEALGRGKTLAELLNRKAGRRVRLKIERDDKRLDVNIRPISPAARTGLAYEAWVADQRAKTEKLSGGKIGYMHIRGMDQASLDRFLREIRTQAEGKKGMVVDCRFNGGGFTAVQILGVLIRQPWLERTTRGEFGIRLSENLFRSDALELPTALMVNTYSFSNAEVIAEGFRRLKLGPIVGERTPGYVIGTGGYSLWDGGSIRIPAIGAFALDGENLENSGRRPDTTVWFDPNAWLKDRDVQLEATIRELMERLN